MTFLLFYFYIIFAIYKKNKEILRKSVVWKELKLGQNYD